jgi:class 3 adenylate cyclase/tetratricopeptide (TPR) repeat protein
MTPPTIEDIRQQCNGNPGASELQQIWQTRSVVPWLRDAGIAGAFVKRALNIGELILACDAARDALAIFPSDLLLRQRYAIALAQMNSTRKAQRLLESIVASDGPDSETLSLLGRTWKDEWLARADPAALQRALECYQRAYALPSEDPTYPGINAATLALLGGDLATAARISEEIRQICEQNAARPSPNDWNQATLAEALAVQGKIDEAGAAYRKAATKAGGNIRELSSMRRNARLISRAHLGRPDRFDECFPDLNLVVFSGHMLDEPDRKQPRFPAEREDDVKAAIRERLDSMRATIGFSSAARGADILFLEAMLERGGAVHVILPWRRAQFIETSVRFNGGTPDHWPERFSAVLDRAASVHELGELYMPSSEVGFDYCNLVLNGRARITARWLDLKFTPLALWDGAPGQPGGTGAFVEHWRRSGERVDIIRLKTAPPAPFDGHAEPHSSVSGDAREQWVLDSARQEIRAMLFGDIVGYSKLPEDKIPKFVGHFMTSVSRLIADSGDAPICANTWGDAIHFVFSRVEQAGRFALALRDMVLNTDWAQHGLVWEESGALRPLGIRIGMHAGPVYANFDPVIRQLNFTGAHVSRAARIEPVTEQGRVFASEEFAALAAAQNARGFTCEFIGTVPLAKNYGMARLYDLRGARE